MNRNCVLLVNLGTPDRPTRSAVRKYLREFLNDPRIIDLPAAGRFALVNGIIIPTRTSRSTRRYRELWGMWGGSSPLLTYGVELRDLVQQRFDEAEVAVEFATRYGSPSLSSVLERIERVGYERLVVLPLFPHHASATTGSALERTLEVVSRWWTIPEVRIVSQFFDHGRFLDAWVDRAGGYELSEYDHVMFSFHGLPERHVDAVHPGLASGECPCDARFRPEHPLCYRNECYETSRLLAARLGLRDDGFTVTFQSRLGRSKWLTPYAEEEVARLARDGVRKLLVFPLSYVADCLETSVEIGSEYQAILVEHGGEAVQVVESLNDSPVWVDAVCDLVTDAMGSCRAQASSAATEDHRCSVSGSSAHASDPK